MIARWLKKRRRGAMAMVAVVGIMPVSAMMNANLNTSQIIEDRRHVQDAADALAKTHGVWSARALNVISMNNVTSTQLLTVAVGSEALDQTLITLGVYAGAQAAAITGHAALECSPRTPNVIAEAIWAAFCGSYHALVAIPAANALFKMDETYRRFNPQYGAEVARKALNAIEGMNQELIARHPRAMREISADYARFLKIDDYHFADPCRDPLNRGCQQTNSRDGMALPLEKGGPFEILERCLAMDQGTIGQSTPIGTFGINTTFVERGFTAGRGPLAYGGSSSRPAVVDHINHVTDIGLTLQDFDRFYKSGLAHLPRHYTTPPIPRPPGNLNAIPRGRYLVPNIVLQPLRFLRLLPLSFAANPNPLRYRTNQQRNGTNDFKSTFGMKLWSLCPHKVPSALPELPLPLFAKAPTLWKLPGVSPVGRAFDRTPDKMDDPFRILAFAQREQDPSERLNMMIPYLAGQVGQGNVAPHTAYGQVGIYNPDGASLYSQSWRARLMPATRMDDVSEAANKLDQQATAAFDPLASTLRQVADQTNWRRIHAH